MFDDLRRMFQQSLAAFRTELDRREPEDEVTELLTAMRRELVEARAAAAERRADVERAEDALARERTKVEECERRGAAARRIGDAETARVAADFAARHHERARVLEQKRDAAAAEADLRLREAEEMTRKYREAEANRFALLAQLRRARARGRMDAAQDGSGDGPFGDFSRMEEAVADQTSYADALSEISGLEEPDRAADAEGDLEAKLQRLKRRMGRE